MTDADLAGLALLTLALWVSYAWAVIRGWRATKGSVRTLFGTERADDH